MKQGPDARTPDFDLTRITVALASAAYRDNSVRFASRSLAGATHLVASRKGLYAVSDREWSLIAHGFFFGLTLQGSSIYAFEACDQPHSPLRMGRIVRMIRAGDNITSAEVIAKGLDNGCHQIDLIGDHLHVVDTYRQVILRFDGATSECETLTPLPLAGKDRLSHRDPEYVHVNSILQANETNLLLLHNVSEYSGRRSEVALYAGDWRPLERWELHGHNCHGLTVLEDGTLLSCDSNAGDLISACGLRIQVSSYMTRGLAVGPDSIAVGASLRVKREDRVTSSGTITFMDRDYAVRSVLDVPGAPTEIRRLDGQDHGLSNYLKTIRWGGRLKKASGSGCESAATQGGRCG